MLDIKVVKNFVISSAGGIILKLISSLIVLISISFIDPEQYGLLSLLTTFIAIFPIFLSLGLRQSFNLDYFHINSFERKKMFNDIVIIYLMISIPILFFTILNLEIFNKYFFLNKANSYLIFFTLLICFLHFFVELLFQILRFQSKIMHLTALQISVAIVNAIIALILLYFYDLKIAAILFANFVSSLLIVLYGFYSYLKSANYFNFNILQNKQKFFYYLKLGFPFIPSILFNWLISFGDRWILIQYTNLNDVGIYSLADSFGQFYQLLILTPLTSSYIPHIFEKFSKNKDSILEIDKLNQKNMWHAMIFMFAAVTVGFFLFKNFLYYLLPNKYFNSINYIWLILIEQTIYLGSYFATCYLVFFKKTYLLVGLTIFSSILNLILNFLLIPIFSINGCIFATIISYSVYLASILICTEYMKNKATSLQNKISLSQSSNL